jgi:hypothetical protein
MYGFESQAEAEVRAARLRLLHPGNRYVVALHKHPEMNIWTGKMDQTVTYGVQRWVPYCEAMPEKFDGFVWFWNPPSRICS